jgi:two-component system chemotaxis response regulator CheB
LTHSDSSPSEIREHPDPEPVLTEKAICATFSEDLPSPPTTSRVPAKVEVVAIGVSTGGPNALAKLVPKLPGDLGVPVVVVQHMPEDITVSLAASLSKRSTLNVREGADGDELRPNVVYLAPGGNHMVVERDESGGSLVSRRIRLNNAPPENSCRPSVDVLFRSLVKAYDGDILAVIMTGMGGDGVKGVQTMKQKRCYCLTQTEETCVVYGMPRSIDEANLSDEKVDLEYLAERIVTLVNGTGRGLR